MIKITSKDNPQIKYLLKLYENKKERDLSNTYIVEGYHLVEEAKKAGALKQVFSIKEEELYKDSIITTKEIISKITSTITPEGIIGVCNKLKPNKDLGNKVLYLDKLQDPGNIGTLLRSALSFNFESIILDDCVDLYNPKVLRSSQGALYNLSFYNYSLKELKDLGYKIISTSMDGLSLNEFKSNQDKVVLILGNEGNGVRKEYKEFADLNLTIPMNKMESLNVGVAGSILMFELNKE